MTPWVPVYGTLLSIFTAYLYPSSSSSSFHFTRPRETCSYKCPHFFISNSREAFEDPGNGCRINIIYANFLSFREAFEKMPPYSEYLGRPFSGISRENLLETNGQKYPLPEKMGTRMLHFFLCRVGGGGGGGGPTKVYILSQCMCVV